MPVQPKQAITKDYLKTPYTTNCDATFDLGQGVRGCENQEFIIYK